MKKNLIIEALLSYVIADMPIWEVKPEYLAGYLFLAMAAVMIAWKAYREEMRNEEKRKKNETTCGVY